MKYADRNGYVYFGANFYHYTGPKNGAYGTSVSSWTDNNKKTHSVDNVPNDTTIVRDTLTARYMASMAHAFSKQKNNSMYSESLPGLSDFFLLLRSTVPLPPPR